MVVGVAINSNGWIISFSVNPRSEEVGSGGCGGAET